MGDRMEPKYLQGLPNELLLRIFGHLPCSFRLTSVARVCHHFKELIDKIEMKTLELKVTFPEQDMLKLKPKGQNKNPMYKLLRKFLDRPLSQLQTSWLPPSYDRFRRLFENLAKHPKMLKEIRSVSVTVQDRSWYYWYFQQNGLLDSLPYLEHLTLSPPPLFSIRFPAQTSNHERRVLRSLRLDFLFLTSQGYRANAYEGIRNVISHHLYWLDLHKLRIDGLDWVGEHFLRDEMTSIRDLWCVGCRNYETAGTATELMRSSTGLVRFIFETNVFKFPGCAFPRPFVLPPLSPFSFYSSGLYTHKCTLQQLVIASSDNGIIPKHWTLGPLDKFCQLEKLAVPFFMMPKATLGKTDYETLPPKLKDLQIEYPYYCKPPKFDNDHTLETVRNLIGKMKPRLPYLERVTMWYHQAPGQIAETNGDFLGHTFLETLRILEQSFEGVDVTFEWVAVSSFWDTPVGQALHVEGDVIIEKSRDCLSNLPTLHPTSLMV